MNDPPLWRQAPGGHIQRTRRAEHWHRPASRTAPPGQVACTLCYRKCVLAPGEDGFCRYRGNVAGRMDRATFAEAPVGDCPDDKPVR
jgi:hypothetical protein